MATTGLLSYADFSCHLKGLRGETSRLLYCCVALYEVGILVFSVLVSHLIWKKNIDSQNGVIKS